MIEDNSTINIQAEVLGANGIFTRYKTSNDFVQHNDYFEHSTFFQCPRCRSLDVERETAYGSDKPVVIVRQCQDCGYSKTTDFSKEDNQ
ncbi:hypothetical protein [Staphylococcus arlettae]|uniref:hypothetical protein n=1 Tax=Staphylococcus arlettae TaxID=29378 RepID=UPI0011A36C01|nr:hypothetical protein [Staphylococcus arlettae]